MVAEINQFEKVKLDRARLERQGVFIFDNPPIAADIIPARLPSGQVNETLSRARQDLFKSGSKWNIGALVSRIPNHVCWLRELLLDTTGIVPSLALDELRPSEAVEFPTSSIFEDDRHLERSRQARKLECERWREIFCECRKAATKACENVAANVAEDAWQHFMNTHVIRRYREGRGSLLDRSAGYFQ